MKFISDASMFDVQRISYFSLIASIVSIKRPLQLRLDEILTHAQYRI